MHKISVGLVGAFVFSMTLLVSGCAFGPLVVHETARTVGESNQELIGGYGSAGYVLKWNIGLAENTDLGFQLESLSLGVRIKHAFINNPTHGFSLAGAAGIGTSVGGNHYYVDGMLSHLSGVVEPYGTVRIVHVSTDPVDAKNKDTGDVVFTINRTEYTYGQLILGSRFWFNPNWMLSVEVSSLSSLSTGFDFSNGVIAGAALGFKF